MPNTWYWHAPTVCKTSVSKLFERLHRDATALFYFIFFFLPFSINQHLNPHLFTESRSSILFSFFLCTLVFLSTSVGVWCAPEWFSSFAKESPGNHWCLRCHSSQLRQIRWTDLLFFLIRSCPLEFLMRTRGVMLTNQEEATGGRRKKRQANGTATRQLWKFFSAIIACSSDFFTSYYAWFIINDLVVSYKSYPATLAHCLVW